MNKPVDQWLRMEQVTLMRAFFINQMVGLAEGEQLLLLHQMEHPNALGQAMGMFRHERSGMLFMVPLEFFF